MYTEKTVVYFARFVEISTFTEMGKRGRNSWHELRVCSNNGNFRICRNALYIPPPPVHARID